MRRFVTVMVACVAAIGFANTALAQVGACCYDDGTCTVQDQVTCEGDEGYYRGDATTCAALKGCCIEVEDPPGTWTWTCINADPDCCVEHHGGIVQVGLCTTEGACCIEVEDPPGTWTWTCELLDPLCCDEAGGVTQGPGTQCTATGACCLTGGGCVNETVCECAMTYGGDFAGVGTGCRGDVDQNGVDDMCEITEAVPALTGPGLLLMAGLLVVAGVVILRRWRAQTA